MRYCSASLNSPASSSTRSGLPQAASSRSAAAANQRSSLERQRRHKLRLIGALEIGLAVEIPEARDQAARQVADGGIVGAHRLVEAHARHIDAVLGAFELALQLEELVGGPQLGIGLRHRHDG